MQAGTTLRVRGEGGAEWDQDVPEDGTVQRELLEDAVAKGRVEILHEVPGPTASSTGAGDDGGRGTSSPGPVPMERPKVRDGKAEWVTWAIKGCGADPDEAAAMSKEDLVKRYGAQED